MFCSGYPTSCWSRLSADGWSTYIYDPSGKRVWASATGTLYFYDIFGKQISTGGERVFR